MEYLSDLKLPVASKYYHISVIKYPLNINLTLWMDITLYPSSMSLCHCISCDLVQQNTTLTVVPANNIMTTANKNKQWNFLHG